MGDCPRCVGLPDLGVDYGKFPDDGHCRKCGSLSAATLMERLAAGTVSLDPTDKNYKVYVHNEGGEKFRRSHRVDKVEERVAAAAANGHRLDDPALSEDDRADAAAYREGRPLDPMRNWRWVTEETDHTKFYFEHLSEEQMRTFVELLNAGRLRINYPGHFYRLPFFVRA